MQLVQGLKYLKYLYPPFVGIESEKIYPETNVAISHEIVNE